MLCVEQNSNYNFTYVLRFGGIGSDRRLHRALVTNEIISGLGWHPVHTKG
jgi:hypothetical protein